MIKTDSEDLELNPKYKGFELTLFCDKSKTTRQGRLAKFIGKLERRLEDSLTSL